MSPASAASQTTISRAIGSPVKSGNGTKGIAKLELFRQGGTQYEPQTMVTRNLKEDSMVGNGSNDVIFYIERPLEKIEERQSESDSELDKDTDEQDADKIQLKEEGNPQIMSENVPKEDSKDEKLVPSTFPLQVADISDIPSGGSLPIHDSNAVKRDLISGKNTTIDVYDETTKNQPTSPDYNKESIILQRRFSEHKSFEMEDIPDENPIKCHPEGLAQMKNRHRHPNTSSQLPPRHFHYKQHHHHEHLHYRVHHHFDQKPLSRRSRLEYPIVRHHPLFAKQPKSGAQSNFSSLLLGQNVRVIRRSKATATSPSDDNSSKGSDYTQKTSAFEIFNPETDDLSDSDEELDDNFDIENAEIQWNDPRLVGVPAIGLSINLNNDHKASQSTTSSSTSSSSSPDSNDSVESVVSARTDDAQRLSATSTCKTTGSPISPNSKSSSDSITPVPSSSSLTAKISPPSPPVLLHQQLQQPTSTTPSILLITEISNKEEDNEDLLSDKIIEMKTDLEGGNDLSETDHKKEKEIHPKPVRQSSPIKHSQSLDEKKHGPVKVEDFLLRSERRRQSLMSLLGENQSVITNIKGKVGSGGLSSSESSGSVKVGSHDTSPINETTKRILDKIQEISLSEDASPDADANKISCNVNNDDPTQSPLKTEHGKKVMPIIPVSPVTEARGVEPREDHSKRYDSSLSHTHEEATDKDALMGRLTGAKPKKTLGRKGNSQQILNTPQNVLPSIVCSSQHPSPSISTSAPLKRSPLSPIMRLPRPTNRGRLDKARSVSPSSCGTPHEIRVFRQSSVPTRFEETLAAQHKELVATKGNNRDSKSMKIGTQLLQPSIKEENGQKLSLQPHLDVVSPSVSDISGSALQSSRESLCGSFESFEPNKHQVSSGNSKTPSPCRSEKSRNSSGALSATEGDGEKKKSKASLSKETNLGLSSKSELLGTTTNVTISKKHPRQQKEMSLSEFMTTIPKAYTDDLLATEYLISTGGAQEAKSSASSRSMSKESSLECPLDPNLGLEKLHDLDPRFHDSKRRGSSGASTSVINSCNSDTDTTSQSGSGIAANLPYRRFDIPSMQSTSSRSHRVVAGRDDSIESTTSLGIASAKSSVQYSDTSSLLSHRFSTISMSSNVSSSDISFGNMTSGSSCYLASMSSADFDDCPIGSGGSSHRFLTTSLSEADETDYLGAEAPPNTQQPENAISSSALPENITAAKSPATVFGKNSSIDQTKGSIVQGIPPQGRKGHFQEKMRLRSLFQRKQQQHFRQPLPFPKTDPPKQISIDRKDGNQAVEIHAPAPSRERKKTLYPGKAKLLLPGQGGKDNNSTMSTKLAFNDEKPSGFLHIPDLGGHDGSDLTPLPSPLPASLLGDIGAVPPSPGVLTVIERKLPVPRSRIGTTTSQDTSLDQTTLIENRDSFEEELFRGLSRDEDVEGKYLQ